MTVLLVVLVVGAGMMCTEQNQMQRRDALKTWTEEDGTTSLVPDRRDGSFSFVFETGGFRGLLRSSRGTS